MLGDSSRHDVNSAASGKRYDDANGPIRKSISVGQLWARHKNRNGRECQNRKQLHSYGLSISLRRVGNPTLLSSDHTGGMRVKPVQRMIEWPRAIRLHFAPI